MFTSELMKPTERHNAASSGISVFITPNADIKHLTDKPPIRCISVDGTCQKRHDEERRLHLRLYPKIGVHFCMPA